MTGDPPLERTIRAHYNTLEWMPIFLPSLWLFAIYWNSTAAAILGLVWIAGRIIYFLGYAAAACQARHRLSHPDHAPPPSCCSARSAG